MNVYIHLHIFPFYSFIHSFIHAQISHSTWNPQALMLIRLGVWSESADVSFHHTAQRRKKNKKKHTECTKTYVQQCVSHVVIIFIMLHISPLVLSLNFSFNNKFTSEYKLPHSLYYLSHLLHSFILLYFFGDIFGRYSHIYIYDMMPWYGSFDNNNFFRWNFVQLDLESVEMKRGNKHMKTFRDELFLGHKCWILWKTLRVVCMEIRIQLIHMISWVYPEGVWSFETLFSKRLYQLFQSFIWFIVI